MTDINTQAGGRPPGNLNSYNPIVADSLSGSFPPGTPVAPSPDVDGAVVPSNGHISSIASCTGIATGTGVVGGRVLVQFAGPLTLTTQEWDAITGETGGLVRGGVYYVVSFSGQSGKITRSPSSDPGDFRIPVGIAASPTDLVIMIGAPMLNS